MSGSISSWANFRNSSSTRENGLAKIGSISVSPLLLPVRNVLRAWSNGSGILFLLICRTFPVCHPVLDTKKGGLLPGEHHAFLHRRDQQRDLLFWRIDIREQDETAIGNVAVFNA